MVALVLFLIVVDLGVNAGRIHYGVSVTGVDLGGMTRREATRELRERRKEINDQVILLTAQGLNVGVQPRCFGWRPNVRATVRVAFDVGRRDGPFGALADRVSSWLWGTKIEFQGGLRADFLEYQVEGWDERLSPLGSPVDRDALRRLLEEAVAEGDTGPFEFPLEESPDSALPTSLRSRSPHRSRLAFLRRGSVPRSATARGTALPSESHRAARAPMSAPLQAPPGLPPECQIQSVTPGG